MTNFKLFARPGIKIRSIASFDSVLVVEPPPPPDTTPQFHFREFYYQGSAETFTVPEDIFDLLEWDLYGAPGGNRGATSGGKGLQLQVTSIPSVGANIEVRVGGRGLDSAFGGNLAGGYNGGGGGFHDGSHFTPGPSGGGATDIRTGGSALTNRIAAAPGGGGGGGDGGYPNGDNGSPASGFTATAATGGTQTAGGTHGQGNFGVNPGTDGVLGVGGDGGINNFTTGGGGGGGGFYGGGGGGGSNGGLGSGSGAGGSALISGAVTLVSYNDSPRAQSLPGFATVTFHVDRSTDKPDETLSYRKFFYTGGTQGFVVPTGIYWVKIKLVGGNGGSGIASGGATSLGGKGDIVEAWLPVVPGMALQLRVPGNGLDGHFDSGAGNYPQLAPTYGGGGGSGPAASSGAGMGGAGGGAADVRIGAFGLSDRLLIAAGGGGGGMGSGHPGGNAGFPNGSAGTSGANSSPGAGATQTTGYSLGDGETGATSSMGGGGGGLYGGFAPTGTTGFSSAGGGSSYTDSDAEDVTHTTRTDTGETYIEVRW